MGGCEECLQHRSKLYPGVNGKGDEDHVFLYSLPMPSSPWMKGVEGVEGLCTRPSLLHSWCWRLLSAMAVIVLRMSSDWEVLDRLLPRWWCRGSSVKMYEWERKICWMVVLWGWSRDETLVWQPWECFEGCLLNKSSPLIMRELDLLEPLFKHPSWLLPPSKPLQPVSTSNLSWLSCSVWSYVLSKAL